MKSIDPYLNFNGNAEEVFNFYKSVFGENLQHLFVIKKFLTLIKFLRKIKKNFSIFLCQWGMKIF